MIQSCFCNSVVSFFQVKEVSFLKIGFAITDAWLVFLFFFLLFYIRLLDSQQTCTPSGWLQALKPADTDWLVICESSHKLWGLRIWLPPSLPVVPNYSYQVRRGPLMFATDCLSHFLSASLLTGPPVAPPDRKVKDTPLEPQMVYDKLKPQK